MAGGITHFDEAPSSEAAVGHIRARWTFLGEAAGSTGIGVRRLQIPEGGWSTPVHEHGREEEIFYVLGGRGLAWHGGAVAEIGAGDCLVFRPGTGGHSLRGTDALDVLAFGPREQDEAVSFARLGLTLVSGRFAETVAGPSGGPPFQFIRESELGPPALPESPPAAGAGRPSTIVNLDAVAPQVVERPRIARTRRNLGRAAGSVTTGLQHVEVHPGMLSAPLHCHSMEHELFVILAGSGSLLLDREETPVVPGHVVSRPAGTGVSHAFRAGGGGLTYLAYGTRENADICWYPTSRKLNFGGVDVIIRAEPLDYWDGED